MNFRLFDYECNAPTHVYGHACGSKGTPPNASLNSLGHDSLIWEVDSWDSQFYLSVDANVNQTSQDGFDATVLPHRCGRGQIIMRVTDSLGYSATTDAFSVNLACVNDPPTYAAEYQSGNPSVILIDEDRELQSVSLTSIGFEVTTGYSETPSTSLNWILNDSSPSVNASNLVSWYIEGSNLIVTPQPNFFSYHGNI